MSTNGYKLNRSLSESDLSNNTLDSSSINSFFNQKSPQIIRRAVVYEEIIDNTYQTRRRYASYVDITGNHMSSPHLELSQLTIDSSNLRNFSSSQTNMNTNSHCLNKIVPMDIDRSHEEASYTNDMEVEFIDNNDHIKQGRHQQLHSLLKRRNNIRDNLDTVLNRNYDESLSQGNFEHDPRFNLESAMPNNPEAGYSRFSQNCYEQPTLPDISMVRSSLYNFRPDKTEPKSMLVKLETNSEHSSKKFLLFAFIASIIVIGYAVSATDILLFVNHDVQLEGIRTSLKKSVHEQQRVVDAVIRIVENRKNWKRKQKMLALTGPRGVGKTHIANVVKNHFHPNLVKELLATELMYKIKKEQTIDGLKKCCLNLIILEDVRKKDIVEMIAFLQSLPKENFILVLAVFNLHDNDDLNYEFDLEHVRHVRDPLEDSDLYYELIVFDHFNDTQVKDWLKKEMFERNVDENMHHTVIKNVIEGHSAKLHGLKGLGAKLSFELEKLKK